jgi:hypothetical protein
MNLTSGLTSDISKSFNVPLLVNQTPTQPQQHHTTNITPNSAVSKTPDRNSPLPVSTSNSSIRPPMSIPPLLTNTSVPTSNPYSAKGALNKKVYESVTSAPVNQSSTIFDTISNVSNNENVGTVYVPPVVTETPQNQQPIEQDIQRFTPMITTETQSVVQDQFQM